MNKRKFIDSFIFWLYTRLCQIIMEPVPCKLYKFSGISFSSNFGFLELIIKALKI